MGMNTYWLLVVQVVYSGYPAVEITHSTSAEAVIPAMNHILTRFGVPEYMSQTTVHHTTASNSRSLPNTWVSNTAEKYHWHHGPMKWLKSSCTTRRNWYRQQLRSAWIGDWSCYYSGVIM